MARMLALTIVAAAALAACAARDDGHADLDRWIGRNSGDLAASWGAPTRTERLTGGAMVLTYDKRRSVTVPTGQFLPQSTTYFRGPIHTDSLGSSYGRSTGYVIGASPARLTRSCITTFTTDATGTIRGWTAEGNDCPA